LPGKESGGSNEDDRTIPRAIHIEIWSAGGQFGRVCQRANSRTKGENDIPDETRRLVLPKEICSNRKILLAIEIPSDINDRGGVSRGSISRNYEGVGKDPSVHPYFERLDSPALRSYRLSFRRVGCKCAGFD
jgi:hypothetical protein